jgi:predicted nucleic acid-binding protein
VKRTYIDAGVLITAFRGKAADAQRALEILDDPDRLLVVIDYLGLEVMPKPVFHKRLMEVEFMQSVFDQAENVSHSDVMIENVLDFAVRYGMGAMDAFHVSSAVVGRADELVTTETLTKPICGVKELVVTSLHSRAGTV